MRTTNTIQEGMARQLVGQKHLTGEIASHETANGRTTVTSQCSKCGGVSRNISLTMASNAIKYPEQQIITCSWGCKYVPPAVAKETYEDAVRVPEARRSSAQQRLVVEHENAERNTQRAVAKQAPINRANKVAMFVQHEKYLVSLAHSLGQRSILAPEVLSDPAYISWKQWQSGAEEQRYKISADVDAYFESNNLTFEG